MQKSNYNNWRFPMNNKIKAFKQFNHKKTNHENITLSLES